MNRFTVAVLALAALVAMGGYLAIGRPGYADQPMAARQAALAERVRTDPGSLTAAELLSRLEQAVREQPEAPEPHFFIGELLRSEGRPDEAARAYQSALRRDGNHVPSLIALADVLVELGNGAVSAEATELYGRAYALDETEVRAGMWAAMGAAQAGDQERALQAMRYIYARLPEDDPRRERLRAMIEAIGEGEAVPPQ